MEKSWRVKAIEGKEVREGNPIEYFPRGSEVLSESQRGRWQVKFSRMKKFLEERKMEGEKEFVLLSVKEERIGRA